MKPDNAKVEYWPNNGQYYCIKDCPHYEEYKHPYYGKTAWCHHLKDEQGFYDGPLAGCMWDGDFQKGML